MTELPPPVGDFLDEHIETVMQLEVLLALHASPSPLSVRDLTRSLGGSTEQVLRCLPALARSGLVEQLGAGDEVAARYVGTADAEPLIAAVAHEYATRRTRVISYVLRDR